jgi:hypothetical protein
MATLQQQIAEKFLAKLAESKKVDPDKIEQLEKLVADGKKIKADEFVKIFSLPAGGDLSRQTGLSELVYTLRSDLRTQGSVFNR